MTQASKEPGDLGVLGLYRGTPISYEFPLVCGGGMEGGLAGRNYRLHWKREGFEEGFLQ